MPLTLPFPTILKKCANVQCTNVPCYSMVFGASFFTATVCLTARRPGILWRPVLRSGGLAFILHSAIPAISRIRICPSLPRNAAVFIRFFSSMAKSSIKIAKNPASLYTGNGYNHSKEYKSSWKFMETHVLKKDMHVSKAISSHYATEPQTVHQTSASVMIPTGSMIVILKTANPCFQRLAAYSMASLRGFEPPAPALGERCFIQLSYRDISYIITDFHRHCKLIFTIISAFLSFLSGNPSLRLFPPSKPVPGCYLIDIRPFTDDTIGREFRIGISDCDT